MEALSPRQRLLRTLSFQPVDRVPDLEFGAWLQTIERWRDEGMDYEGEIAYDGPLERYFGTDDAEYSGSLPANVGLCPPIEEKVLEDHGTYVVIQDADGAICEQMKPEYGASIPRYLRYMIESRADWARLRDERLDPTSSARVASGIDDWIAAAQDAQYPTVVWAGSLYGWIRNWMGVERLSMTLYDDRAWVEEMTEHLTRLTLSVLARLAAKGLTIDLGFWWEDMCYNHGPLISPRLFPDLLVPRYARITGFLRREFGCRFNILDCDGNIHALVPLWLEGGVNIMFPLEAAHTDAFRISDQFGRRVALRGGFDKRALIAGPAAIDAEFQRLRPLLERGGFIPHTDHRVPPDVSFESYLHYRRRKCEFIGKEWREPGLRR